MELDIIQTKTTWNDAAGSINSNYVKIADAIAQLKVNSGGGGGGADIDLTEYATKVWVKSQSYITAEALIPYAKSSDLSAYLPIEGGTMTGTLTMDAHILPTETNSYDIGSSALKFKRIYANYFYGNLSGTATSATTTSRLSVGGIFPTTKYGNYAGILQTSGTTNATVPQEGVMFNILRIFRNVSTGYYTDLAQSLDGEEGLYYRRMQAGTLSEWKRVVCEDDLKGYLLKDVADTTYLGIKATAADAGKLGGQLPSYYATSNDLTTLSNLFNKMFEFDSANNAIKAKLSLYSVGGITAGGVGSAGGGGTSGGGGISEITSEMVVSALGYTPYNASNPSGYITASALNPYALKSEIPTSLPASDVYDWAKASVKPTYSASEVGALGIYKADADTNLDTLQSAGVYSLGASGNTPARGYSNLFVAKGGRNTFFQLLGNYQDNNLYYRGSDGNKFTEWQSVAFTSQIPTQLSQLTDDVVAGNYLPIGGTAVRANTISLNGMSANTTYGEYAGIIQSHTGGAEEGAWHNSLRILHNNSSGYYTEICQNFTGTDALYYRRMENGSLSAWHRVLDERGGYINENAYLKFTSIDGQGGKFGYCKMDNPTLGNYVEFCNDSSKVGIHLHDNGEIYTYRGGRYTNVDSGNINNYTAGAALRLAHYHTLWGRPFDGTDDVTGSLSGVVNLTASGNITADSITIGGITLSVANGALKIAGSAYTTGGFTAGGVGSAGGGGTSGGGGISEITSEMVVLALGYTPYNASNPSGYITVADLAPYLKAKEAQETYATINSVTAVQNTLTGQIGVLTERVGSVETLAQNTNNALTNYALKSEIPTLANGYGRGGVLHSTDNGYTEVGIALDFHRFADDNADFSTRLQVADSASGNIVLLPTAAGTLALTSQIPTQLSQLTDNVGYVTQAWVEGKGYVTLAGDQTISGVKRFTASMFAAKLNFTGGTTTATLVMDGSSLSINQELKLTKGGSSDICTGIAAAFKTNLAQTTNLITNKIIMGTNSGQASTLPIEFCKYTSISNTAPSGVTTLMSLDTNGNLDVKGSLTIGGITLSVVNGALKIAGSAYTTGAFTVGAS